MRREAVTVQADTALVAMPPATALRVGASGSAPGGDGGRATMTLVTVSPSRAAMSAAAALPEPAPAAPSPAADVSPDALPLDDTLRPPIARDPARLRVRGARAGVVELDVRVDETGEVTDALVVSSTADSAQVQAAIDAAQSLSFVPARLHGRAIAVWCRQRVEFGR